MLESPNSKSDELFKRALKVAPGGVHSPVRSFKGMDRSPIFFQRAEGAFLFDVNEKKYIDYCQSFGPLILGHRDPEIQEVVLEMVHKAWSFGACEPYSLELGEWLQAHIPWVEKLRFVSSGTEAVMSALRVARGVTGRDKILKFDGCYHGHVDSLLVQAGSGLAGEAEPSSKGIPKSIAQSTVIAPLDNDEEFLRIFQENVNELAAVIIEPLPANYGLLPQRTAFLKLISETCRKNNVLFIFDEVISGFRVALGGMAEITGITPDLVCYGKILGGGFPVGCYAGKREYMDIVAPLGGVYQAGTLSANPIGMCAGLATLKKIKRVNAWKNLSEKTLALEKLVQPALQEKNLTFTSFASLFWIHQSTPKVLRNNHHIPSTQSVGFKKLFLSSLDQGLYLAPNAYEVGFMSLAHSDEVIQETARILKDSISEI
jgi:glutamate-1-semialdehyde 2,1-aminomutase